VKGKMFALTDSTSCATISVKCDPDDALAIRETFAGVIPGYHLNKRHWNTITNDGSIPDEQIFTWIADSYALVVRKLPVRDRARLV
jgi:predicted DNA-binding protein (MmcQ/YjbR family)